MESGTPGVDEGIYLVLLVLFERFTVNEFLCRFFRLKQLMPPCNDIFWIGFFTALAINMQNNVVVIGKYREGSNIYVEDSGKFEEIVLYLMPAVFIGTTGDRVLSTQKSTSYATRYTVVVRRGIQRNLLFSWFGYRKLLLQLTSNWFTVHRT